MKRLITKIVFFYFFITSSFAQHQRQPVERIHAAKMAYITDRLHLSVEQSGGFIPVYNEFEKEIRATRKAFNDKYRDIHPDEADDTTSKQYIDDNLDYQARVIDIKRKYNERFLKIITSQQLSDLYKAEREFRKILMHQMEQRQKNGNGRGGPGWDRFNR